MSIPSTPEPGPIAAVLFDLGGVITESPFEAFQRYEADHGLPPGFIRTVNASNYHDNAWARLERNFDAFCDAFEAEALAAGGCVDARALFALFSGRLRPEMVEVVRRCARHYKTGLLTNNFVTAPPDDRQSVLGELLALFDAVVESSVIGVRKPDPRFYLRACDALAIRPDQAVFLDDLGVNLKAARSLGMTTIKVTDPGLALEELESVVGIPLR